MRPQTMDGRNWLTPDYTLLSVRDTQNAGQRAKKPNGLPSWTSFYNQFLRMVPN
jgi:hypothetical protein